MRPAGHPRTDDEHLKHGLKYLLVCFSLVVEYNYNVASSGGYNYTFDFTSLSIGSPTRFANLLFRFVLLFLFLLFLFFKLHERGANSITSFRSDGFLAFSHRSGEVGGLLLQGGAFCTDVVEVMSDETVSSHWTVVRGAGEGANNTADQLESAEK